MAGKIDMNMESNREKKLMFKAYLAVKRLIDFSVAAASLMLLSPLMLAIGIIIKVTSSGPLFFRQRRVGLNFQEFDVLKFRTMINDADKLVEHIPELADPSSKETIKVKEDYRIFTFGNILRKTSLDELPQLFNILVGQMSLVGPRPLIESEIELCSEEQKKRLSAKPGLTGWAQINGRGNIDFDKLMELDLQYIQRRSFLLDFRIMLKTIYVVLSQHGAY